MEVELAVQAEFACLLACLLSSAIKDCKLKLACHLLSIVEMYTYRLTGPPRAKTFDVTFGANT